MTALIVCQDCFAEDKETLELTALLAFEKFFIIREWTLSLLIVASQFENYGSRMYRRNRDLIQYDILD